MLRPWSLATLCVLLVAGVSAKPANEEEPEGTSELEILCGNGIRKANLRSYNDLILLIDEIRRGHRNEECPARVEDAIKELAKLIDFKKHNICTLEKAAKIGDYYREFLDTSRPEMKQVELPKTLKRFALAYGLHVTTRCKSAMVDKLVELADDFKRDFEFMADYISDESMVGQLLSVITKRGELWWPEDLIAGLSPEYKLTLNRVASSQSNMALLKSTCERRFKPIYVPLMLPIVELVRYGFDYNDKEMRKNLKKHKLTMVTFNKWSRVMFLCEALNLVNFEPVQVSSGHAADSDEVEVEAPGNQDDVAIESYNFDQILVVQAPRVILDTNNIRLMLTLRRFDTSKTLQSRNEARILKASWRLMHLRFKFGDYSALMKSVLKKLDSNKNIIKKSNKNTELEHVSGEIENLIERNGTMEITKLYKVIVKGGKTVKSVVTFPIKVASYLMYLTVGYMLSVSGP